MLAVSLCGIDKRFGAVQVLDGIDLAVPRGAFFALLGVNGAGKTTLMRILMGFARPSAGGGSVLGRPLGRLRDAERAAVAYVPERPRLYESMRVGELLAFVRSLQPRWDGAAAARYLDLFGLPTSRPVGALSIGMRSQLALTVALAGRPELLLLDEPAAGLDPVHRRRYLQVLLQEGALPGRTVVVASHDLDLVERACDHLALIHQGRVRVAGPLHEILDAEKRVRVTAPARAETALANLPGLRRLRREEHGFLLSGRVATAAVRRVAGVSAVQVFDLSVEDLFWSYVEDDGPGGDACRTRPAPVAWRPAPRQGTGL